MGKQRLEAFSDGVLAIIITVMLLEMKVPIGDHLSDLKNVWPLFLSYILSFVYVGIYWNNHHHFFHLVEHVDGKVMWSNLLLLFSLSLIPFASGWMGENHFTTMPVVLYGIVLFMSAISFNIMVKSLLALHGKDSLLAKALTNDRKSSFSNIVYLVSIPLTLVSPYLGLAGYALIACIWFIPDKRVEKTLETKE
jgi:uncharacterized membrane protein